MTWLILLTGCLFQTKSPATGDMACTIDTVAIWRVPGAREGALRVKVDTIDATTTFDPAVEVHTVDSWSSELESIVLDEFLESADDIFPCTFPPPDFECPQLTTNVSGLTEDLLVAIYAASDECAGADAAYELTVEIDDRNRRLRYLGNIDFDDFDPFGPNPDDGT